MDLITYALCRKLIKRSIESLGDIFTLKGNVDSVESLPSTGNHPGDIYLVGPNQDGSYDEYYWTSNNEWEVMGTTENLDGVITETTLYKGEDGTGTVEEPAEDTILYIVNNHGNTFIEGYYYNNKFWEEETHETEIPEDLNKIYVDIPTNNIYRYSENESDYIQIGPNLKLGITSTDAFRGDYGNTAYLHATDANKLAIAKTSGLYKIATTSEGHIASATEVQKSDLTALGVADEDSLNNYAKIEFKEKNDTNLENNTINLYDKYDCLTDSRAMFLLKNPEMMLESKVIMPNDSQYENLTWEEYLELMEEKSLTNDDYIYAVYTWVLQNSPAYWGNLASTMQEQGWNPQLNPNTNIVIDGKNYNYLYGWDSNGENSWILSIILPFPDNSWKEILLDIDSGSADPHVWAEIVTPGQGGYQEISSERIAFVSDNKTTFWNGVSEWNINCLPIIYISEWLDKCTTSTNTYSYIQDYFENKVPQFYPEMDYTMDSQNWNWVYNYVKVGNKWTPEGLFIIDDVVYISKIYPTEDDSINMQIMPLLSEQENVLVFYKDGVKKECFWPSFSDFSRIETKVTNLENNPVVPLESSPLKTIRGDYLVIDDNANPYIYDIKLLNRKTASATSAGELVPLDSVKPGPYTINFVKLGPSGIEEKSKASSENNFTFSKIRCGEKWMLKGRISSSYYSPSKIKAKFYDINNNFILEKDLTYCDYESYIRGANASYFWFKDVETPEKCAYVEFSIPEQKVLSSPSSGKQYFEIEALYWQKDYKDIEINKQTEIETVPLFVSYEMYGLQKDGERRTNYWYASDWSRITGWGQQGENFYYSYALKNISSSNITLNNNVFSMDLWANEYYSVPFGAPDIQLSNVCSNYYLPVNSTDDLQNKTFCIVPGVTAGGNIDKRYIMRLYIKDEDLSSKQDFLTFCENNNIVVSFKKEPQGETPQEAFYEWRYDKYSGSYEEEDYWASFVEKMKTPLLATGSTWGKPNRAPWQQQRGYGEDTFIDQYTLIYVTGPGNETYNPIMEITYYQNISNTIEDIGDRIEKTEEYVTNMINTAITSAISGSY